jgi:membrane protease YdiL (CAAX protease family)
VSTFVAFARRFPLATFVMLDYAFTRAIVVLSTVSVLSPLATPLLLVSLFGPAVAGLVMVGITEGKPAARELLGRLKSHGVAGRWHLTAALLPIAVAAAGVGLNFLMGGGFLSELGHTPILVLLLFPSVLIGQEIGWRGYALPRLLRTHSALTASLMLGCLYAVAQLPIFIFLPENVAYGRSFVAFLVWALPLTVVLTWLYRNTKGSLTPVATLHSGLALSVLALSVAVGVERAWLLHGAALGILGLGLLVVLGPGLVRESKEPESPAQPPEHAVTGTYVERQGA